MKKHLGPLLGVVALLAGCNNKDLLSGAPGDYEGYVAVMANGQTQQTLVSAKITAKDKTTLTMHAQSLKGNSSWDFTVKAQSSTKLTLNGAKISKSETNCFTSPTSKSQPAPAERLCFDGHELGLDLTQSDGALVTMIVDRIDPTRDLTQCKEGTSNPCPTSYTAAAIIERTIDQNFGTREEFETVVQARLSAEQSALLLLPHLSAGTIQSVVFSGWSSLLHAFSDLIPFVFLDRDFLAKEASVQARATAQTLTIEKADAGNIAEGLTYTIDRDTRIIATFNSRIPTITGIRDNIKQRELLGLIPVGSSDDITSILNSVQASIAGLQLLLDMEYTSLAQTAGFIDPKSILSIEPSNSISIENPIELDEDAIRTVALQRSYEIDQIDLLVVAAHWDKWSRMFAWYDPGGNPGGSIGANIVPFMQVNYSQLRQLAIQKDAMRATVATKVANSVTGAAHALELYGLAKEAVEIQERRVERTTRAMAAGLTFSLTDLVSALQAQVTADVNKLNAEANYYLAISSVNRLLYAGPYGRLAAATDRAIPTTSGTISLK